MINPEPPPRMRCHQCGDVIGVYEPLVLLSDGDRRETSLAAEPDLTVGTSSIYHSACSLHAEEHR